MNARRLLSAFALVIGLSAIRSSRAGFRADPMPELWFDIPWFHSTTAERHAREACASSELAGVLRLCRCVRNWPQEHAASLVTPWLILGGRHSCLRWSGCGVKEPRRRAKQRQRAQRRHDPKAFRKLDKTPEDRAEESARDTLWARYFRRGCGAEAVRLAGRCRAAGRERSEFPERCRAAASKRARSRPGLEPERPDRPRRAPMPPVVWI